MWQLQPGPESACSGIFDMRWAPPISQQPALLALALADGMLKLVAPPEGGNHSKERQGAGSSLDLSCSVEAAGSSEQFGWTDVASIDVASGMILTVDWGRHPSHQRIAVVSTSTGYLATVEVSKPFAMFTESIVCRLDLDYREQSSDIGHCFLGPGLNVF
jgi:hypothetical protein